MRRFIFVMPEPLVSDPTQADNRAILNIEICIDSLNRVQMRT